MPLGESMISSLKSNKSIKLDKTSRFRKTLGGYGKNKKTEFNFPEATPELLENIKIRTKRSYVINQITRLVLFIILFILSIWSLVQLDVF